jgi:trehalose 6-phosphate synthase/phosphatase
MSSLTQTPPLLSPISTDELGQLQLYLPSLKVVSYRGPGESGGVPTSLEPIVKRLGSKIHWFAVSGVPSDKDERLTSFAFHNPEIPQSIIESHKKLATGYLWPLLHGMPEKAVFDQENWKAFRLLNEMLATEVLTNASQSFPTLVWLHDYQLSLVAPLISMQAGVLLCQFWHVPWPEPQVIADSPIGKEIVESLLCNRVLGFHTTEYATNFLNTVQELLPNAAVDMLKMEVRRRRQTTKIVVMPLGIDFNLWQRLAKSSRPIAEAISVKYRLANQIVLGVDRLDYNKGVLEKLNGIEEFLEKSPTWQRRFHYVQLAQTPQSLDHSFVKYAQAVEQRVEEINAKFGSDGWQPIILLNGQVEQSELSAWYQAADVLAVNPVRDGLNLIAKEYVASRLDEQGAVILSRHAGCAAELAQGAILIDPSSPSEFATALQQALSMEVEEKRRRMTSMRRVVGWNQLHDWALGFLKQSLGAKSESYLNSFGTQ